MLRIMLGAGVVTAALLMGPSVLLAQAPVVLACQDGETQPGSSKIACQDHKGIDWEATKMWTEMRAGHYMTRDTVVCIDGQAKPAAGNACSAHGGVDSVSTQVSWRRRAKARRFLTPSDSTGLPEPAGYQSGDMGPDSLGADSGRMSPSDSTAP